MAKDKKPIEVPRISKRDLADAIVEYYMRGAVRLCLQHRCGFGEISEAINNVASDSIKDEMVNQITGFIEAVEEVKRLKKALRDGGVGAPVPAHHRDDGDDEDPDD